MAAYIIEGGTPLNGDVVVQGSKNAVLPLMAAALVNRGITVIDNCPHISDVYAMADILMDIGCSVIMEKHRLIIDATDIEQVIIKDEVASKVRASVLVVGALLARTGYVRMNYPGGCLIGARPVDYHLKAFEKMGALIVRADDYIECRCKVMTDAVIELPFPSVGATENILLAAMGADGVTVIRNAAREPEIVELCELLHQYGCKTEGAGSGVIRISGARNGVQKDVRHNVMSDRIVAGTYLYAAAMTRGNIICRINNCRMLKSAVTPLVKMGCKIRYGRDYIHIISGGTFIMPPYVVTEPYPGFPTDMQSQLMSVMAVSEGRGIIREKIFENRFHITDELIRMGADIEVDGDKAVINGVKELSGAEVISKDLRGGAALIIAGLGAGGVTRVTDNGYIARGYEDITGDMLRLGGNIRYEDYP